MKNSLTIYFVLIAFLSFVVDRLTKIWVVSSLSLGESIPLLGNTLHVTYVSNKGGAFGLFTNQSFIFVFMGVLVPIVILIFFKKLLEKGRGWVIAASLILGGALGNLYDRIFFGCVIDFIDVRVWPIFNVADIAISVGIGILFICIMREGKDKSVGAGPCACPAEKQER